MPLRRTAAVGFRAQDPGRLHHAHVIVEHIITLRERESEVLVAAASVKSCDGIKGARVRVQGACNMPTHPRERKPI